MNEQEWSATARRLVPERDLAAQGAANATRAPVPDDLLHASLWRHAMRAPERPAIISRARTLSYGEAERRSRALAAAGQHSPV